MLSENQREKLVNRMQQNEKDYRKYTVDECAQTFAATLHDC